MIAKNLREALHLIDRHGWVHNYGHLEGRGYDLVSALQVAFSGVPHGGVLGADYHRAHEELQRITGTRLLGAWNDDPARCKHEVLAALVQAIGYFASAEEARFE